jgi:hypothetical protein
LKFNQFLICAIKKKLVTGWFELVNVSEYMNKQCAKYDGEGYNTEWLIVQYAVHRSCDHGGAEVHQRRHRRSPTQSQASSHPRLLHHTEGKINSKNKK